MYDEQDFEELQKDFKRKELLEHALGPSVSLILHAVLFLSLFFLVTSQIEENEDEHKDIIWKEVDDTPPIDQPIDIDPITNTDLDSSDIPHETLVEPVADEINTEVEIDPVDIPDLNITDFATDNPSTIPSRTPQGKAQLVAKAGGSSQALSTVLSALKWLRANQNPDGSWDKITRML